jgi:hypothetical protein
MAKTKNKQIEPEVPAPRCPTMTECLRKHRKPFVFFERTKVTDLLKEIEVLTKTFLRDFEHLRQTFPVLYQIHTDLSKQLFE